MTRLSRLHQLPTLRRERGFTAIELAVVITVIGIMASVYARYGAVIGQEQRGKVLGQTIATIHNAAEDYARRYRTEILNNTAITVPAAVAVTREPTTAEFFALGQTPNSISAAVARAGNIQVRLSPSPVGCVMPACEIQILTYIDGPVLNSNNNGVETTVLAAATREAGARAGGSESFAPTRLRGLDGAWDAANPVAGNPVGIFAMISSTADIGTSQFVQIRDSRDPDLQGNLSVAQALTIGGATTLNGATTVNNSANVTQALTVGGVTTLNGATTVNNSASVTQALNVGTNLTVTQVATANRFVPSGAYALNAACVDQGAIARSLAGVGLVYCQGGFWRALATQAAAGGVCAPNGTRADDAAGTMLLCVNGTYQLMSDIIRSGTPGAACTMAGVTAINTASNNETLICKSNPADGANVLVWFRLRDLTQNMQFVFAYFINAGAQVPKPTCPVGATQLMIATPKATSSADGGVHVYGTNFDAWNWTLNMVNGAGITMPPGAEALVQTYCYFP